MAKSSKSEFIVHVVAVSMFWVTVVAVASDVLSKRSFLSGDQLRLAAESQLEQDWHEGLPTVPSGFSADFYATGPMGDIVLKQNDNGKDSSQMNVMKCRSGKAYSVLPYRAASLNNTLSGQKDDLRMFSVKFMNGEWVLDVGDVRMTPSELSAAVKTSVKRLSEGCFQKV